ncbi:MAG: NADH-quinone oxidoreductase subunit K [Actinomycetota bacterium]|nr:Na(+)/H(+) antiporter subunit C [Acidimicrobiaceae bacterium]MEC8982227.1 NADH-quinone oxidoreductase subunit K [Actinomycetota bacterium]MEC9427324.1 NADH-quinone oxidoreductase subunit K [Actinomycetota bacterium]MEC9450714.1 NADH-quinone oxidoreductase subunit K [Actinomycetota bacterium]MED5166288.1 NADH-quinone oxidoreductase subunit K [Actinomycetota bacterium]|tara:strand:+ start:2155 stop:2532 length:378 start_codon:yes stop_codon:yes gene_type:complete
MTTVLAVCVAVLVTVSIYLMLSRELKSVAMGVFVLGHGANLAIIAMSGSPVLPGGGLRNPPILGSSDLVDALPQALILTAIVINFAVMGFLLTLLIVTARRTGTLNVDELATLGRSNPGPEGDDR